MSLLEKHPLSAKYQTIFNRFNINTELRLAHFFGQLKHESNLKPIEENLRYTAQRLLQVFPKYFTLATAKQYAMNPQAIANKVYANRMGNGPEASGDGYRFRGRGFIQLTGKHNYAALTRWANANGLNVDYVENPSLLLTEADALISALWYWDVNRINRYADKDDIMAVSRLVNLGNAESSRMPNGMQDRIVETNKFKQIFRCT